MEKPGGFRRELTFWGALALGLGSVLGAGIFVVTGLAASVVGPAFLLGMILAGGVALCNGFSCSRLARRYPYAGGTYEYGCQVLTPQWGFAAGWMFLVSKCAAAGAAALGTGAYLRMLWPSLDPRIAGLGAVVLLTLCNLWGIKKAGRLNQAVLLVTLASLGFFVIRGLPQATASHFTPFMPQGPGSVLQAASLLFFAFTGYARITTLGSEVKDPQRTIPRVLRATLLLALALYLAVGVTAVGLVGAKALGDSSAPLDRAALAISGSFPLGFLTLGAACAMVGVLLSQILGISRMMYAMAQRGDLPAPLGRLNQRGVPKEALFVTAILIFAVVFTGTIPWIAQTASVAILLYYSIANLCALSMPEGEGTSRRYVSWIGLFACLLLALSLSPLILLQGALLLGVGFLLRAIFRRWGQNRQKPY
ncbi:hypothetical protein ABB02_00998 [Clostridiaceae bacterium JG1575]|nr:hypothetical protein ABB02_00998 [Clostridiaceae bacterium JG1575]